MRKAIAEYDQNDDGISRGDFLGFLRSAQEKDPNRYTDRQIVSDLTVNMYAALFIF